MKNSDNKKIAIIIPTYNVESYLMECLESLKAQTYDNFIAFIIDDGSTDRTGDIADAFATSDSRFKCYHQTNAGVASARNFALDSIEKFEDTFLAVGFLDGDDRLLPECLEKAIRALEGSNVDYVVYCYRRFDKTGYVDNNGHSPMTSITLDSETIFDHYLSCNQFSNENFLNLSKGQFLLNKLFRLDRIRGLRFNENMKRAEDINFFLNLRSRLKTGLLIPDVLLEYRLRKSSLSHGNNNSLFELNLYFNILTLHANEFTISQQQIIKDKLLACWRHSITYVYSQAPTKENINHIKYITNYLVSKNLITSIQNRKRLLFLLLGKRFMKWHASRKANIDMKRSNTVQFQYYE